MAAEVSAVHEKCTRQLVQTVARKQKYHSNLQKEDLYIAGIAIRNIEKHSNLV